MKKAFLILLLIIISCNYIAAGDSGVEDLFDYGAGARAMGMGNSFVAVADDSSAIYWNSAGLGSLGFNEIMLLHTTLFGNTYYNFISFAYPTIDIGTFGIALFRIGTGDIIFRDSHNLVSSRDESAQYLQFLIGYGIQLGLPFNFGTSIKINSFQVGSFSDANISFDAGLLVPFYGKNWRKTFKDFSIRNLQFGINFKNLVSTPMKLESKSESDQLNVKIGLSYYLYIGRTLDHKIMPTLDVNIFKDRGVKFNAGLEYTLYKNFFLRGGYDQNIGVVIGGALQYWDLRFDYSLAFQEVSSTHRFSLMWRFGKSVEQQRAALEERAIKDNAERVKEAVERETREYKARLAGLEKEYQDNMQKTRDELTSKYQKEKDDLIKEVTKKSEDERKKMIEELTKKYEDERIETLNAISNQFSTERKKLTDELNNKLESEKGKLRKKIVADEQFKTDHYTKGIELFEKGDYDGAIAEFESVLRFDQDYGEAQEYLQKAKGAKKKPTSYSKQIMDLYYKGIDFYVAGEYEKAINIWKQILKIDPYNKLALRNINDAEKKIKELEKIKSDKKRNKK
ncbi:MAG: PorV/PorQ family protein [Spirochaetes bacterium]|nr:PorV/PorQ family protein [Spirochaetota bacterium]